MGSRLGGHAGSSATAAVLVLAALLVGIGSAAGSSAGADFARCAPGSVVAVVDGKRVCLRTGQRCRKHLDPQYHRYGFHCHGRRLTGGPKPAPPGVPAAGTVVASIPAPSWGGIAAGAGAVWVSNLSAHTVTRVDPATNTAVETIPIGREIIDPFHGPTFLGFGHGTLWVLDGSADCGCVHRIDPSTSRTVATIGFGTPTQFRVAPLGIVVRDEAVWVALRWGTENAPAGSVVRIDPATNEIAAVVSVGSSTEGVGPTGIAATATAVWAGIPGTKSVVRIDPSTNSVVASVPGLTCGEGQLAADESGVWVADCDAVRWIDARTNRIARTIRIPGATGGGVRGIALEPSALWVQAGPLIRIDPARGAIVGRTLLDPSHVWGEYSVAIGFGSIWVRQVERVVRIRP
jgi:streptogramin lyase